MTIGFGYSGPGDGRPFCGDEHKELIIEQALHPKSYYETIWEWSKLASTEEQVALVIKLLDVDKMTKEKR